MNNDTYQYPNCKEFFALLGTVSKENGGWVISGRRTFIFYYPSKVEQTWKQHPNIGLKCLITGKTRISGKPFTSPSSKLHNRSLHWKNPCLLSLTWHIYDNLKPSQRIGVEFLKNTKPEKKLLSLNYSTYNFNGKSLFTSKKGFLFKGIVTL